MDAVFIDRRIFWKLEYRYKNISKSFNNKIIFSNLSYSFYHHNYHLIGINGSGKTTLLRLISGLESPDNGTIIFNNDYVVSSIDRVKNIYYIPDDLAIYPFLKGIEFLSWIGYSRAKNFEEITEVVDRMELISHQNTLISDMSFGTKKKFLLASALIEDPDFIILDEPLNGLDKQSQCVLLNMLQEKSSSSGIILTTHQDLNIDLLSPIKTLVLQDKSIEEKCSKA